MGLVGQLKWQIGVGGRIFAAIVGAFGLVLVCTALFDLIS
jgi:hypothetical protein